MEIFGILFGFAFAFVLCLFVPAPIYKFINKSRFARLTIALLSGVFLLSLAVELTLTAKFGIVAAHDRFHPLLDRLQGFNTVIGPLTLTSLAVIWLRSAKFELKVVRWCAGFVCFCAFGCSFVASLFYNATVHYRADSEGIYRIEEKEKN